MTLTALLLYLLDCLYKLSIEILWLIFSIPPFNLYEGRGMHWFS